jgi:predicted nucleic-acid-binding Zn-ribbon protein
MVKCPHCGGIKGFKLIYNISGNGSESITFKGKVFDVERNVYDNVEEARCLDCDKEIDLELLKYLKL